MNLPAVLLLTIAGALPVEATLLDGTSASGELTALSTRSMSLEVDGQSRALPVEEVHELRLATPEVHRRPAQEMQLRDGSRIAIDTLQISARSAGVTSPVLGQFEVPRASVHSVRLAKIDSKIEDAWNELLSRETRDDLLVVRKGDALDHIAGVVSAIDGKAVQLLLDGSPVPVPRERAFGVIFASAPTKTSGVVAVVDAQNGDRLAVRGITLREEGFQIEIGAGPGVQIAAGDIARIDFSLGKISYLSDVEPTQVTYPTEHELFLLEVWKYRKGTNSQNDPLRIGVRNYERGLWIHSGTSLTWRLNREYRHLRGVAGIAAGIGESCDPTVGLVIRGDGRELLSVPIARGDEPLELDVDISGVRELQLEVTSTNPDGICEHLGLGDVRVIK